MRLLDFALDSPCRVQGDGGANSLQNRAAAAAAGTAFVLLNHFTMYNQTSNASNPNQNQNAVIIFNFVTLTFFSCAVRCCIARRTHRRLRHHHQQQQQQQRRLAAMVVVSAWKRHFARKRARLQLRMLRDARDMKHVVPSSRTSRIANLKKLPLTERGLKSNSPLPPLRASTKEGDSKASAAASVSASAAAAAAATASTATGTKSAPHAASTSTSRTAIAGKVHDRQKQVTRHTAQVAAAHSAKHGKQGGAVGVGIVFAHEGEGQEEEVLSVKQFVRCGRVKRLCVMSLCSVVLCCEQGRGGGGVW
jgi:hypothetical protein